jgi:hypothetical protein
MIYPIKSKKKMLYMLALTCNSSTWEDEEGGLEVQGQPGLYEIVSNKVRKRFLISPIQ